MVLQHWSRNGGEIWEREQKRVCEIKTERERESLDCVREIGLSGVACSIFIERDMGEGEGSIIWFKVKNQRREG